MELQEHLSKCLIEYSYRSEIITEIINAVKLFNSFDIKISEHVFTDGRAEQLLTINGAVPINSSVIPAEFRRVRHSVPIALYLRKNFPLSAPICFISPEENQELLTTGMVDSNCRISLSYLEDWKWPGSDLRSLFEIMIVEFSSEIPLIFLDEDEGTASNVKSCESFMNKKRPVYENFVNRSKQTFTCCICEDVIKPPAILATCCGQIIGCDSCVKEMKANNCRRCPLCRKIAPGLKPINGLDEFFEEMNGISELRTANDTSF